MKIKQILSVVKLNGRLQLAEPTVKIILMLIPLIMTPFMLPAAKIQLVAQGYTHANGSEQVIPGLAVLLSFFSIQLIIQMFFDETTWNTWDRQQVSATSLGEIITGKVLIAYLIQFVQISVVLLLSVWLFHFHLNGSWPAFIVVIMAFSAALTFFGTLLVSWTHSANIAISLSNLLGMLMAGLGGSLSPTSTFPHWAKVLAKIDPAYWALSAIKKISLDHAGLTTINQSLVVLLIMACIFGTFSLIGFNYRPLKEGNN
ncbi:ABC transporter permease [Schleiferilactobacillus perolens]|uniref:Multidrug ABC transporter permease n=1 Tax=Schleiferilactobacillus perolens DSM 12744 TaxID=1423792 RepID=A0A0R1MWL7_9LACO|nr:ABC transporter permease [Schleiferilactobacillus perolens]KRL12417.1 multidrug ABC transporter permease [Schleiferilactobacillus perolens DSM 12744]